MNEGRVIMGFSTVGKHLFPVITFTNFGKKQLHQMAGFFRPYSLNYSPFLLLVKKGVALFKIIFHGYKLKG